MAIRKRANPTSPFTTDQFVGNKYWTAEEKARTANHFVKFVQADMPFTLFPQWFYVDLVGMWGHIAHYNRDGFYGAQFGSTERKYGFLKRAADRRIYGDPGHTRSDIEQVLKDWLNANGIPQKYEVCTILERGTREIAMLEALLEKHPLHT